MRNRFLILILFLLPLFAIGQKKYKYHYKERLINQPSTFTVEIKDTLLDSDLSILEIQTLDNNEIAIPHVHITIKTTNSTTSFYLSEDGFVSLNRDSDTHSITLFNLNSTPLTIENLVLKEHSKTIVTATLGEMNALRIASIFSSRKLSKEEIKRLIEDLSNGNNSELIENKTCYILWEI